MTIWWMEIQPIHQFLNVICIFRLARISYLNMLLCCHYSNIAVLFNGVAYFDTWRHSYRTFKNIQQWLAVNIQANKRRWKLSSNNLKPITTEDSPAQLWIVDKVRRCIILLTLLNIGHDLENIIGQHYSRCSICDFWGFLENHLHLHSQLLCKISAFAELVEHQCIYILGG